MLKAKRKAVGHRITIGTDKAYDTKDHIENLRAIGVTPHMAQNKSPTKPPRYVEPNVQITRENLPTETAKPQIFRFFRRLLKGTPCLFASADFFQPLLGWTISGVACL